MNFRVTFTGASGTEGRKCLSCGSPIFEALHLILDRPPFLIQRSLDRRQRPCPHRSVPKSLHKRLFPRHRRDNRSSFLAYTRSELSRFAHLGVRRFDVPLTEGGWAIREMLHASSSIVAIVSALRIARDEH